MRKESGLDQRGRQDLKAGVYVSTGGTTEGGSTVTPIEGTALETAFWIMAINYHHYPQLILHIS